MLPCNLLCNNPKETVVLRSTDTHVVIGPQSFNPGIRGGTLASQRSSHIPSQLPSLTVDFVSQISVMMPPPGRTGDLQSASTDGFQATNLTLASWYWASIVVQVAARRNQRQPNPDLTQQCPGTYGLTHLPSPNTHRWGLCLAIGSAAQPRNKSSLHACSISPRLAPMELRTRRDRGTSLCRPIQRIEVHTGGVSRAIFPHGRVPCHDSCLRDIVLQGEERTRRPRHCKCGA